MILSYKKTQHKNLSHFDLNLKIKIWGFVIYSHGEQDMLFWL